MRNPFDHSASSREEREASTDKGGISPGLRAVVLFALSAAVFLFTVFLCLYLIRSSGNPDSGGNGTSEVKPLEYEINVPPTQPVTQVEDDPYQLELMEPQSGYDSSVINILFLGVEEERNDTQILCSVNLQERSLSLLSIPRDTYVSGDYDVPKAKNIYGAYEEDKRIDGVKDALLGMLGFEADYYFLLDRETLTQALSLTNGLPFEVPEAPAYHSLEKGSQTLDGSAAFELFRYKEDWEEGETDSTRLQRTFLLSLMDALLTDANRISEVSVKLSEVAKTDLSVEELAYLGYLLSDFDFAGAYSRALPGEGKEIDGITYYQVNTDQALTILNDRFNPLEEELTAFSVNFRQEQGDSGEGQYSDYGFSSGTTGETSGSSDGETSSGGTEETDPTEGTDPTESTDSGQTTEATENPEPTEDTEPTEETEASPETEAPVETEATEAPAESGDSQNGTT